MKLEEVQEAVQRLRARREEYTKLKDYRPQRKGGSAGAAPANIDGLLVRLMAKNAEQPEDGSSVAEGGEG